MRLYANPLGTSADFADPFVLRFDGRYYLYCTGPLVECWTSEDLVTWSPAGPTIGPDVFPGLVPFAPEVHYAQGTFYMVTSPHGRGHHVLSADSPLGPFHLVTGNLGRDIDGHVLVDDDGTWYFYWAGWEGIWGCEMPSPTELGEPRLTGAFMGGWTEGPFVTKRGGRYYMTFTGNHFLSPGYRIHVAVSDDPLTGYRDDPLNPVLISAEGSAVGLGHSSSVLGPDLVSTYVAYHGLLPDRSRQLHLDRQVWCGRSTSILGPSRRAPAPNPPTVSCRWSRGDLAQWRTDGDLVPDGAGWAELTGASADWHGALMTGPFTAELTFAAAQAGTVAIRIVGDDGARASWVLDAAAKDVSLDGVAARLPTSFASGAPHLLRLEHDGASLTATLDGGTPCTIALTGLAGARLVVDPGPGTVSLGHIGLTATTPDATDRAAVRPVPGRFWAALTVPHGAGFLEPTRDVPQRRLVLEEGQAAKYRVLAAEAGRYELVVLGDLADGGRLELVHRGGSAVAALTARGTAGFLLELGAEVETLMLRSTAGRHVVDLVQVFAQPASQGVSVGPLVVRGHDKRLVAEDRFVDVDLDVAMSVDRSTADGHGDVLLRASQLALGYEGDDARLGTDFLLGYSVQVHGDGVVLARHDYDTRILARWECPLNLFAPVGVQVSVRGARIAVRIDGQPVIDYVDALPHMVGGIGVRAVDSTVRVVSLTANSPR